MPRRLRPAGAQPVAAVALAGASLIAAAAVGSIFLSSSRDAWSAIAAGGPAGPADGILLVVSWCGVILTLWLGLGLALSALSALPGALGQGCSLLAAQLAPAAARKIVTVVLGTTLTAALVPVTTPSRAGQATSRPALVAATQIAIAGPADAAPNASLRLVSDAGPAVDSAPAPSWSLEGPSSPRGPALHARHESPADRVPVQRVTVQPGDTLWSIAAHHLGTAATSADIDAAWHRWFAANRTVIGNNANHIAPGQLLNPPAAPQGRP